MERLGIEVNEITSQLIDQQDQRRLTAASKETEEKKRKRKEKSTSKKLERAAIEAEEGTTYKSGAF